MDCLEDSVRRLGQHNAHLVQQIKESLAAGATSSGTTGAATASVPAAAGAMHTPTSVPVSGAALGSVCTGVGSTAGAASQQPMSPKTLHSIIAAATRVNEKNKKLKRQLQLAMQQQQQQGQGHPR